MMASARMLGNCEHPRLIIEYGPLIGMSEYGDIGSILRTDTRGSLFQRNTCPTFTQQVYNDLLQVQNDEMETIESTHTCKIRALKYGRKAIDRLQTSTALGGNMIQPIELIKSLMPEGIVETWSRRGKKESLVVEMYKEVSFLCFLCFVSFCLCFFK